MYIPNNKFTDRRIKFNYGVLKAVLKRSRSLPTSHNKCMQRVNDTYDYTSVYISEIQTDRELVCGFDKQGEHYHIGISSVFFDHYEYNGVRLTFKELFLYTKSDMITLDVELKI